jgi:hypothetical protein
MTRHDVEREAVASHQVMINVDDTCDLSLKPVSSAGTMGKNRKQKVDLFSGELSDLKGTRQSIRLPNRTVLKVPPLAFSQNKFDNIQLKLK